MIPNFSVKLSCVSIPNVYYVLEYLCGYLLADIVICLVPSCVICYFRDVVKIMEGVL